MIKEAGKISIASKHSYLTPSSNIQSLTLKTLRAPAAPYTAILLCDRILLNRHVILHYTILKPYIHWKGMLLSRHQCHLKTMIFQYIYGFGVLRQSITGFFIQFWSEGKIGGVLVALTSSLLSRFWELDFTGTICSSSRVNENFNISII